MIAATGMRQWSTCQHRAHRPALERGERACGQPQRGNISHMLHRLHAIGQSFPFSGVSLPSPVLAQPGDTQDSSSSRAKLSVRWEPSAKCLGMFLLPSQIWFTIRPNTAQTPLQEKVTWDCFTALVPRAASLKQWPEAH